MRYRSWRKKLKKLLACDETEREREKKRYYLKL